MSSWPVGAAPKKPSRHRRYTAAKALATEHPAPPWHGPPPAESTARAMAVEICSSTDLSRAEMNVQIHHVIRDLAGTTGLAILAGGEGLAQERKDEGKSEIVKLATHERNGRG